jgi:hypothetical protein
MAARQQPRDVGTDDDVFGESFGLDALFDSAAEQAAKLMEEKIKRGFLSEFSSSVERMTKRVTPRKVRRTKKEEAPDQCARVFLRGDRAGMRCDNDAEKGCEGHCKDCYTDLKSIGRTRKSCKRRSLTTTLAPKSAEKSVQEEAEPNSEEEGEAKEMELDARRLKLMESPGVTEPEPVRIAPLKVALMEGEPAPKKPRVESSPPKPLVPHIDLSTESPKEQAPVSPVKKSDLKDKFMAAMLKLFEEIQ